MNPLMNPVGSNAEGKLNCINAVVITQKQFIGFDELFFYYGSHFPHGEYPAAIASSRV